MIKILSSLFTALAVLLATPCAMAIDESLVREKAHTVYHLYLTPYEALNLKTTAGDDVLFIDVRARAELKYVGAPQLIDANIPYRFLDTDYAWSDQSETYRTRKNPHFIEDLEKLLEIKKATKSTPVIIICTSGTRAPKAAKAMHEAGFEKVYSVYQGFEGVKAKSGPREGQRVINGWKNAGLPWSYKLKTEAMYFNFDSSRATSTD
jgi:rhodanese-related sulfurtransferase